MKTSWTRQDSCRASKQGWDVFTTVNGVVEIEKNDHAEVFKFDYEAVEFVLCHAKKSKTCRKAVKIVYGF